MVLVVQHDKEMHAMTANAVTSLSLDPLLVLVCIEKKGRTHTLLQDSKNFTLSILSETQTELGKKFAYDHEARANPRAHTTLTTTATGAPVLKESLGYLDCRLVKHYEGGDHTIFIGEVVDAKLGGGARPLMYYGGKFITLDGKSE
jgi:flavin reductase (DIM6/NTAB) family NADH-FMN oxidoreductase RutF